MKENIVYSWLHHVYYIQKDLHMQNIHVHNKYVHNKCIDVVMYNYIDWDITRSLVTFLSRTVLILVILAQETSTFPPTTRTTLYTVTATTRAAEFGCAARDAGQISANITDE